MSINIIQYKGIIHWKDKSFLNPEVWFSARLIPYHNDLVVIATDTEQVIVPYSNQEQILGVVTQVKEGAEEPGAVQDGSIPAAGAGIAGIFD